MAAEQDQSEIESKVMETESKDSENPFNIPRLALLREVFLVLAVFVGQAMVQACLAQGIFADSVIAEAFGVGEADGTWGPAAYALTAGTFMLPAGRIGDIYGHRLCFVGAYAWFSISSLMTGVSVYSKSFVFYSVCRGLQGIGPAVLVPTALAILGSIYKEGKRKNLVFSIYAAGSPIGYTLGGIFSALITQLGWWPWMFYVTALVCCAVGFISYLSIPKLPAERPSPTKGAHDASGTKFDWWGSLTGVSGLILFNYAWNRAPAVGWQSPDCIATLIIGCISFVVFVYIEKHTAEPLIPISHLDRHAVQILTIIGLAWSSFGILIYYLLNFTLIFRKDTLLSAAAQVLPVPFAGCIASYLNTFLLTKGFSATDILAFSTVWFLVGSILLATLPVHQTYWEGIFWIYTLSPFGMDLSFPSGTLVLSQLVPVENQGIAASLIATVVYYSQSIGLGIAGTVQTYVANGDELNGYRGAFYTGIGLAALGLLTSLGPVVEERWRTRKSAKT